MLVAVVGKVKVLAGVVEKADMGLLGSEPVIIGRGNSVANENVLHPAGLPHENREGVVGAGVGSVIRERSDLLPLVLGGS
jgi:hypothetical protein